MAMFEEKKRDDEQTIVGISAADLSALSAAHWKGTTLRDDRNPIDLMVGSKFPREDRPAQDIVKELIAISNAMKIRWEAYQSYQAWVREDVSLGPEPTFQDEQTGEPISGRKALAPSPRVNESLNDFVVLTLKQFTPELQSQVLDLCEEGPAREAVDRLRQIAIHAEESMEQEALELVFQAVDRHPDTYKANVQRLARQKLGIAQDADLPATPEAQLALFEALVVDYPRELQQAEPELYQGMVFPYFDNYAPLVTSELVLLTTPFIMQRHGTPYHFAGGPEELLNRNPGLVQILKFLEDKPAKLKAFKEQHPALFGLQDLSEKVITFVGAGFPLTGVVQSIITGGMKVQLVDYDKGAVKNAIRFIGLAESVGAVEVGKFRFLQADARDITYVPSHQCKEGIKENPRNAEGKISYILGTDLLDLASALPRDVTEEIMEQAARAITVIRKRNVEGMSKLLYEEFQAPANSIYHMAGVVTPPQKVIAGSFEPEDVTSYSLDLNVNSGSVFHNKETFVAAKKDLHILLKEVRHQAELDGNDFDSGDVEPFCARVASYYRA